MSCTTILVGKHASYDGSTIIARNDDSPSGDFNPKRMDVVLPEDQPRSYRSMISHAEVDLTGLEPMRYSCAPNVPSVIEVEGIWAAGGVNDADVAMTATETLTSNPRVQGADPLVALRPAQGTPGEEGYQPEQPGGIGEEDFVTLVLPYIRSAREGVLRLGGLLERNGTYEMNGIAFSDLDEVWWLETVGGHHWIARRVPDDCYVAMPNQLGIDRFDLADAEGEGREYLCSPDLRAWMAKHHLDLTIPGGEPDVFNPREAFGSASDADHVYNTPRAWSIQRHLNPRTVRWDGPDATFTPESDDIPWCVRPERLLAIEDVKYVLSLHYQGTPFDCYGMRGAADMRGAYRPIGINRNNFLSVTQLRPYLPPEIMAVQWIAEGSNAFNALVPFYANVTVTPDYLANTTGAVSTENFYWANRLIGALADAHYSSCISHVERYQLKVLSQGQQLLKMAAEEWIKRSAVKEAGKTAAAEDGADGQLPEETADSSGKQEIWKQQTAECGKSADGSRLQTHEFLELWNQRIADMAREETDKLLEKVLFLSSLEMRNGFSRDDK